MRESNWKIVNGIDGQPTRVIMVGTKPILLNEVYNYVVYTPVLLVPINKSAALVLSEFTETGGRLGLKIHDLRIVPGETEQTEEIVSSLGFSLRGGNFKLQRVKSDLSRVADKDRCIGISYFLRKLFYGGFSVLYAPKILTPKTNSTLRAATNVVSAAMKEKEQSDGG